LADARANDLVLLFNHVAPSLIRVEADEVTYNLHIALRFELEEALISARIKAQDVREMWRTKMKKYLGIVPKTDREGVLQDVHWSYGNFGYFPTYTLGNLYAAQFTEAMKKDLPFEKLLAKGEFGTILSWFRDNIHCHGSRYLPKEFSTRISGKPLDVNYFIRYVEKKYKGIYGV
jgi:carboxypeptidase Taq